MANETMGELICAKRRELGMTQRELAEQLGLTDKAVSKWERDVACPDIGTLPRLAELLGVSVEALLHVKSPQPQGHRGAKYLLAIVLRAVPMALGIAVAVTAAMGELPVQAGQIMLGVGLACMGIYLLQRGE